jgi:hypothetical protein
MRTIKMHIIKTRIVKTHIVKTDTIKTHIIKMDTVKTDIIKTDITKVHIIKAYIIKDRDNRYPAKLLHNRNLICHSKYVAIVGHTLCLSVSTLMAHLNRNMLQKTSHNALILLLVRDLALQ